MSSGAQARSRAAPGAQLRGGSRSGYLSLVVLLPLAALIWSSRADGRRVLARRRPRPRRSRRSKLTLGVAAVCALVNAVAGTAIAWVLVRDRFPGKGVVDAVIDLPFALPTIVAGLTLLALYGPAGPSASTSRTPASGCCSRCCS